MEVAQADFAILYPRHLLAPGKSELIPNFLLSEEHLRMPYLLWGMKEEDP